MRPSPSSGSTSRPVELDFAQVQKNKEEIIDRSVSGVGGLLKANGVTVVEGRGEFTDANTITHRHG